MNWNVVQLGPHKVAVICAVMCQRIIGRRELSWSRTATPRWMVYFLENPIKIDDFGLPPILGNLQMYIYIIYIYIL